MKTPFVSIKQKKEYEKRIVEYENEIKIKQPITINSTELSKNIENVYSNRRYKELSLATGLLCSVLPLVYISALLDNNSGIKNYEIVFSMTAISVFSFIVILVLTGVLIRRKKYVKVNKNNDDLYELDEIAEMMNNKK